MVSSTHREFEPASNILQVGTLRSLAEAPIKIETEIDIGLRRRPIEDFFLKGPIPLVELVPIAKMPGKTLALWLLIAHRVSYSRKVWVTLPAYALEEWGISKDAKIDALRRLERAGKVLVTRPKGGYLKVRLLWKRKTGTVHDRRPQK
jgi:hypothetical protein